MQTRLCILAILLSSVVTLSAQDKANRYFNYLQQIYFENEQQNYNPYLKTELLNFQRTYPAVGMQDQVLWMLGNLAETEYQQNQALAYYMKIALCYPNSALRDTAWHRTDSLISVPEVHISEEQRLRILNQFNQITPANEKRQICLDYLTFLVSLDIPALAAPTLHELDNFVEIYGKDNDQNMDVITLWKGRLYSRLDRIYSAIGSYEKILALYSESPIRTEAQFELALLHFRHGENLTRARDGFLKVINIYPDHPAAAKAQFFLARLYADSLHDYTEAISNYQLFVEAFPDHPLLRPALNELIRLTSTSERYEETISAYMQFYEHFPHDSVAQAALDSISAIYRNKFNNYTRAAQTDLLFASSFQSHPKAAHHLLTAAQAYAKLNAYSETARICRHLLKLYPDGECAGQAKVLLEEILDKTN